MKNEGNIEEGSGIQERPVVGLPSQALEDAYKKDGNYDGKIFHSEDKVTYTFLTDQEVVSLHYDLKRDTIFYKGHKIDNMELDENMQKQLEKLGKVLREKPEMASFALPYQKSLQLYLQKHSK
ncbi:MAG: hypothetical protein Q7T11_09315 [Deltaproteobacteria bacterium]|nr:hypothetical protein [Deltaproteobacteria bacterium]